MISLCFVIIYSCFYCLDSGEPKRANLPTHPKIVCSELDFVALYLKVEKAGVVFPWPFLIVIRNELCIVKYSFGRRSGNLLLRRSRDVHH